MMLEAIILASTPITPPPPLLVPASPGSASPSEQSAERAPEERLRQAIGNMFELIEKPDSRYATFVTISSKTRLLFIETKATGFGDTLLFQGDNVKKYLTAVFTPREDVLIERGKPEIALDGAFGRVSMNIVIREGKASPQCSKLYFDGIQEKPGWWTFTQIVLTQHDDWWRRECPAL